MSQLPRPRREADHSPLTLTPDTTFADLERARPAAAAARSEAAALPSSWPDLLHLLADILADGIPMLEKGGKANVLQVLLLYAKIQAAWQSFKALRKPAPTAG